MMRLVSCFALLDIIRVEHTRVALCGRESLIGLRAQRTRYPFYLHAGVHARAERQTECISSLYPAP